jgi:hypothetical protein
MSAAISGTLLTSAPDIAALIRATELNCGGRRMDCFACARNDEFIQHLRQSSPTGKSFLFFRNNVKPENQKNSALSATQISRLILSSTATRGAIAIVTNVRWDAMDAKAATDERSKSVR